MFETQKISTTHLVSVATGGAPSMTGAQRGFVSLLEKSLDGKLLTFHCILLSRPWGAGSCTLLTRGLQRKEAL